MRLRLKPVETVFYDLFSDAARNLVDGARLIQELLSQPPDERPGLAQKLRDAEHRGDDITHTILRQLNATFVTPFDREDIYRLASRIDDVMDHLEAAGDLVVLYEVERVPTGALELAAVLVRSAEVAAEAIPRLRSMKNLEDYWVETNRLENEADGCYRRLLATLFKEGADALTVIKSKEILDELEAAADAFEHVADTVETIVVKES